MKHQSKGFLRLVILLVIALIILGYFGIDVRKVVNLPQVQENLAYGFEILKELWGEIKSFGVAGWKNLMAILKELKGAVT